MGAVDVTKGGEPFDGAVIPALRVSDDGKSSTPLRTAVVPVTFVGTDEEDGVTIEVVDDNDEGHPHLVFSADAARALLAELIRHVRLGEAS